MLSNVSDALYLLCLNDVATRDGVACWAARERRDGAAGQEERRARAAGFRLRRDSGSNSINAVTCGGGGAGRVPFCTSCLPFMPMHSLYLPYPFTYPFSLPTCTPATHHLPLPIPTHHLLPTFYPMHPPTYTHYTTPSATSSLLRQRRAHRSARRHGLAAPLRIAPAMAHNVCERTLLMWRCLAACAGGYAPAPAARLHCGRATSDHPTRRGENAV